MTDKAVFEKHFAKGKKDAIVKTNNVVIYTRVSDIKQMDNLSLETQLRNTNDYAKKHNLEVREYFGGTYESAKSDERKQFKLMIDYVKKSKFKISQIIVYSLDRFTRNENTIWLLSTLRKMGIEIISVSQPIDISNPSGLFQQKMLVLFNELDNSMRRMKCMAGMKETLLNGNWPHKPPIGYDIVRINDKRSIVINAKGKFIKQAFLWKAHDKLGNEEIRKRLHVKGLDLSLRAIGEILANPFYCGILSHNMLEGEVREGNHERLITHDTFLKVNQITEARGSHIQKKEHELVPLKRFLLCDECGHYMRGYIVKKWSIPYYKCNTKGCKVNKNANDLHEQFVEIISDYQLDVKYTEIIKTTIADKYQELNADKEEHEKVLKKEITELAKTIENFDDKYARGKLADENLYLKYSAKFAKELEDLQIKLPKARLERSKLDECIDFILNICSKLPQMWASGDYKVKQKLQKLVFPNGLRFNKKNNLCRSEKVNSLFTFVGSLSRDLHLKLGANPLHNSKTPIWTH